MSKHQFKDFGLPEERGPSVQRHKQLELVKRVRIEDTARDIDFAGAIACIPPLDWAILKKRFPELISPDPQIQRIAWNVFLRHPASEPYRTKERRRKYHGIKF